MTNTLVTFALLLFLSAASGARGGPAQPRAGVAGSATAGKKLYMDQTCYFCHGTEGQGGVAGARLAATQRSPEAFIRYIRRPTGAMPAYSDRVLSDQQLTDIYAFLRSVPAARPAKDIPLLVQLKDR
jgi:mono/diheme cytochrome c family protein